MNHPISIFQAINPIRVASALLCATFLQFPFAVALKVLSVLRDYYTKHKDRLVLIQNAREEYKVTAAAYFFAHPQKPENHTFWLKPYCGSRYLTQEGSAR